MVPGSDVFQSCPGILKRGGEAIRKKPVIQHECVQSDGGEPPGVPFAFVWWEFPVSPAGKDEDRRPRTVESVLGGVNGDEFRDVLL